MEKKIPITIGIIGHLDAVITAKHKQLLIDFFDHLNKLYPASPVCLFSQLAPGADTEIVNLFFDIKDQTKRDYYLIAPIPFKIDAYQSSFNEKDKQVFQSLLAKAKRYFVLQHANTVSHITESDLYRMGGQFIADSAIILIAIWDNKENGKKGGTADIVHYKKEGLFKGELQDKIYDQKVSLISLECNRTSQPENKEVVLPGQPLFGLIEGDAGIIKCLNKIEQLNVAAEKLSDTDLKDAAENLYADVSNLSQSNLILRNYYSIADVLAVKNQKRNNTTIQFLFFLGFVFIILFELSSHDESRIMFFYTLGVGAVAFILYLLSKKRWQNHFRFLEDRIIAEVFRIQFFWNLSNVRKFVTNYILRIYKSEFIWFKHFLQAVNGVTSYHDKERKINTEVLKTCWLTSELKYFEKKIVLIRKTKRILDNISIASFIIAILLMVALLPIGYVEAVNDYVSPMKIIIGIGLGIFALSSAYIEIKGLRQTINQYSLMKNVYNSSIEKLTDIENENIDEATKNRQISRLFYLAGKEALVENGNWYLIFKDKEPKVQGIGG